MVKLFSVSEMKELEKEANDGGLSYQEMMENAGQGIANEIQAAYSHTNPYSIVALVGSGNNGGDALVALTHLGKEQWQTAAYVVRPRVKDDPLMIRFQENGGEICFIEDDIKFKKLTSLIKNCSVLLDGVLGTGVKLPLKAEVSTVLAFSRDEIKKIKGIHVVAVDCPSGVDCDTGAAAPEVIPAEMTITMAGVKLGLIKFPAAELCGGLRIASIGTINQLKTFIKNRKIFLEKHDIGQYLPDRPRDAHKGTYGTALIIAGSVNFTGAALLSGLAAYRIGTGLVTMGVPAPLHEAISGQLPECTWILLPHEMGVISEDAAKVVWENCERATALLLGPGFGQENATADFVRRFFTLGAIQPKNIGFLQEAKKEKVKHLNIPMVIDADGLKLLAKIEHWYKQVPAPAVLTPHPGEMSVLTGLTIEEIQEDRIEIAKRFAKKWGHIVVLKGAFTIIAEPGGQIAVVPVATSALAKAGTGDVLAGLIVGLRAQGVDAFQAASAGAWIHANAGLLAAERWGNTASVLASDVIKAVPYVITDLQKQ